MFGPAVDAAAKAHALAEYPNEAVGVVAGGAYLPQENLGINGDRRGFMRVRDGIFSEIEIQAVIHSHVQPSPRGPGKDDMESQISTDVPWGIVQVSADGTGTAPILWFGEHVLDMPLIGRPFVGNVTDCYELVRGHFWQKLGIKLRSFPRDFEWWTVEPKLIEDGFAQAGFVPIPPRDAQPNDGLCIRLPGHGAVNHCAVLLENGLMLHHLRDQLSKREPWSSPWRHLTRSVVRFVE